MYANHTKWLHDIGIEVGFADVCKSNCVFWPTERALPPGKCWKSRELFVGKPSPSRLKSLEAAKQFVKGEFEFGGVSMLAEGAVVVGDEILAFTDARPQVWNGTMAVSKTYRKENAVEITDVRIIDILTGAAFFFQCVADEDEFWWFQRYVVSEKGLQQLLGDMIVAALPKKLGFLSMC